jgi:hypothetical protein
VGALSQENLYQVEGVSEIIASVGDVNCRGSHTMNSIVYLVLGTTLYRVDYTLNPDLTKSFALSNLGTVAGSGRVIMASIWSGTGYELAIVVPGQFAYYYTEAGGVIGNLIGLPNFANPVDDVVSINGFCVFLETGTNKVFHSNLNDIATYNALDFELITRTPKCVGLVAFRGQMYVMGEHETLPYSFIGGLNFVFQYQPNSTIPSGLDSLHAKTTLRQSIAYLGGGENESPAIWLTTGGSPQKISNESIEYLIRTDIQLSQAFLFSFAINGGEYIVVRVGNYCFVFDLMTQRWHQRRSTSGDNDIPWRVNHITDAYGELICGDSISGRVGILDNSNNQYETSMHRYFITQPFDNKGRHISLRSLVVATDTGYDGALTLDWSDDGGKTWSDALEASTGAIGDYGRHVRWDRLGSASYARMLRIGTSDNSPANINKIIALP